MSNYKLIMKHNGVWRSNQIDPGYSEKQYNNYGQIDPLSREIYKRIKNEEKKKYEKNGRD
jgi:hypothetical protein